MKMKKIINGIRYDTGKATPVGSATSNLPTSDFHHWEETLYVSPRSGRFFLAGEGGPFSKYGEWDARRNGHSGEAIVPMSRETALGWASQNLDADTVEKYFGDSIEDA